ncbi:ArsR/SmtB family transcription factor [Cohnella nanjingensis]|uniref:Winged helix-turn-helix transcriptional regulator n=1 Tax=Cohnella nanjingensis TaxID=1387779 RepID=A0A7X0RQ07_9BACL|nr:metalloregulator ArsR/SmtB family transcription factor [Cohnella nanjingensis]MBB6671564.1 winged helix-turn-helix transcriptional regulator [Cohnella nanjingensis]
MRQNDERAFAQAAKVLSDPIRLQILSLLKEGRMEEDLAPVCSVMPGAVCPEDLRQRLEDISSSKLSYHLKELKEQGFIQECREGKRIYYNLLPERFERFVQALRDYYR